METKRFLMVSTHYPPYHMGGDAVFVEYLSKELAKRGHEAHVFHNPAVYELLRKTKVSTERASNDEPVIRHPYSSKNGRIETLSALALGRWGRARDGLSEIVRNLHPDVVHWHNTKGFIGRPFHIQGVKSIYTAHDYYLVCPRSNLLRPDPRICDEPKLCALCTMKWRKPPQLWRLGRKRIIRLPKEMVSTAPSEFVANRLRKENIQVQHVIRNFVPDPGKRKLSAAARNDTILYLGILERHKGVGTLIEGFRLSMQKHSFNLAIVGNGSLKESLQKRVKDGGMEDRVSIPGFLPREDLDEMMWRAQALIVPSEWCENAPLVVLEALARGLPIIGSDVGGLPEILTPESGSIIFRAGNPEAVAHSLQQAWDKKDEVEERGRKARSSYEASYTPEACVSQYLSIIQHDEAE